MSDRNLLERVHCMVRIAPQNEKINQNSWSDESVSLTTEQKIFAINNGYVKSDLEDVRVVRRKKEKKKWKNVVKKWIEKCPWTVPWTMIILSAIQLFFNVLNPPDSTYQFLAFKSTHQIEIWRFLTYSLLHAGTAHLIINIILQLFIALPLETEVGHLSTLWVYLGGVLSGSLAASVTNDGFLMVGASSGIYSLLMSHIPHIWMNFEAINYRSHRLTCIIVLILSDVIHSLTHCLVNNNEEPRIHIAAHVSGALCGILLGFIFYQNQNEPKRKFWWLKIISMLTYAIFVILVIAINFR